MTDDIVEINAIFQGYVQGVGFRYTACEYAIQFGIIGTVRNLPDGNVEVYALGKREIVQKLLDTLSGPQGAGKVLSVSAKEVIPHHHYSGFKILT